MRTSRRDSVICSAVSAPGSFVGRVRGVDGHALRRTRQESTRHSAYDRVSDECGALTCASRISRIFGLAILIPPSATKVTIASKLMGCQASEREVSRARALGGKTTQPATYLIPQHLQIHLLVSPDQLNHPSPILQLILLRPRRLLRWSLLCRLCRLGVVRRRVKQWRMQRVPASVELGEEDGALCGELEAVL